MKRFLCLGLIPLAISCGNENKNTSEPEQLLVDKAAQEQPAIDAKSDLLDPNNFISGVTNPYFTMVPGRKLRLEGQLPEGINVIREILASDNTQEIQGVTTWGLWEREFHDGSVVTDAKKWYAQDKDGNVWLFGEDKTDIFGGFARGNTGSWRAGEAGAKAGIVVPGTPEVGETFNAEFNGMSEHKVEVLGVAEAINTPGGALKDCLKIRDLWIKEGKEEHLYYCKESGNLSRETGPRSLAKIDLANIEDNFSTSGMSVKYPELKVTVSEESAKKIAFDAVDGAKSVASASIQLYDKKPTWVVEVTKTETNDEARVYVHLQTGAVLEIKD